MKRYIITSVLTFLLFVAIVVSLLMRLPVFAQTATPTQGANIGQPVTFDAPLILSGEKTISAYKFVDSTDDTYFLDPSAETSLVVSGNVGIGTTAPSSISKIHVVGPYSTTFGANYGLLLESTSYAQYSKTNIGLGIVQGGYPQALIGFDQQHNNGNDRTGDIVFGTAAPTGPTGDEAPPVENMRITHDGRVGIGTTAPLSLLSIGGVGNSAVRLQIHGAGTTNATYDINAVTSGGTSNFYITDDGGGYLRAAAWSYGSDRRLKENIVSINGSGLDTIQKLNPVKFDYINGQKGQLGFIAQDVQQVIPEAVDVADEQTGYLGLKTDFIVPYLVKGMQELNAKVNKLTLEAKKLIIDGVDVMKKLTELSNKVIELSSKVESQQKQIEELSKQIREMKN